MRKIDNTYHRVDKGSSANGMRLNGSTKQKNADEFLHTREVRTSKKGGEGGGGGGGG